MAKSHLRLDHPRFLESFRDQLSDPETSEALNKLKEKVEVEHTSCNRVVQKFYGNHKFTHLHDKIWKYDWGSSSATGRKSWRLVVVVPNPDVQPYELIAAAIYAKNVAAQLTFKQLAIIFARITSSVPTLAASEGQEARGHEFRRVPNGDGRIRSICTNCIACVAVETLEESLESAEQNHICEASENCE